MLSGHFQGRVLSMLMHMIKPKRILEIGTYTGYSAICMAEGLIEGGELITIDINEELEDLVNGFIKQAGFENKIVHKIGNALEIIPQLEGDFDVVFIDADKKNYINYYHSIFDKIKPGGYIIADNVLWSGKVVIPQEKLDYETKIIMEYNDMVHHDVRVQEVLLPIRDGLLIARKR
jgi:predicted O-methyltransferase YrrM